MHERALKHVLVVEDEDMVRDHVVRQLNQLGHRVSEAPDGLTGLDIIRTRTDIDLLFTDIVMPGGMSGKSPNRSLRSGAPSCSNREKTQFVCDSSKHSRRHGWGRHDLGPRIAHYSDW